MGARTFDQARAKHLARLDQVLARLRDLAADPTWRNRDCRDAIELSEALDEVLSAIVDLNNAEHQAS
jgi:hypothetical protein